MEKKIGELGRTEWALMKICWKKGKSSARVIFEESLKEKQRSYHTVKTILDRLVKKDYLEREKFGPIWLYSPKVSETSIASRVTDDFIKTVLDNTIAPVFLYIVKNKKYSNQIEELRRLINDLPNDEGVI